MLERSYRKPRGYPGDYQTMVYCYENRPEGSSAFDQVFHKFFVEHPLAHGVRTRAAFVMNVIREEAKRLAGMGVGGNLRVTSLGCGPAYEVQNLAKSAEGWPGHILWSLMDQEEEALLLAYQTGTHALANSASKGSLECLHFSFAQFLMDPKVFPIQERQHLIYSVGFFDYVRERMGQGIIHALYDRLEPGGVLLIGNARGPNRHFWSLEFLTDWTLLYRTEEAMRRLARKVPETAEISVELESGEAYFFLSIRKPQTGHVFNEA